MESEQVSKLRNELVRDLRTFNEDQKLRRLSSMFLSYKIVIGEFIISTLLVSNLFFGAENAILGGFSNLFLFSMISLLLIIPINAAFGYGHLLLFKKKWKESDIETKTLDLINLEMNLFEKNLNLNDSTAVLPDSKYLSSLAYFSQEFLLFGPRNENLKGKLDDIDVHIQTSQDYLGYEGRLLVITLSTDIKDSNISCDISYQEKEYFAYGSSKKVTTCINALEVKNFVISFFEAFSLRSQGWIKITKDKKFQHKVRIDIIIDDYIPLSAQLYMELGKYLKFLSGPFLSMLKLDCEYEA